MSNQLEPVSESITFEEAMTYTQSLVENMQAGNLSDEETEAAIASLVKSENGARGFFVTYLTGESILADNPSEALICGLKASPEIVGELLVKNLAMSAAMAVTHRRNNNQEMAMGSERVRERSANLIQELQLDIIKDKLQQLQESATKGEGNYQVFLKRWGYDAEQLEVIEGAIKQVI